MARLASACLLLAALSLLGPSEPSYDPWAWLVWGREIGHLTLDTTGGPSWKPLPVVFTTLFGPLSAVDDRIPPALWIVVARAGGLLALVLAFRVAARVAGGGLLRRTIAGGVAALALALSPEWIRYLIHGNEAPLAVGLGLLALDRHLEGRRNAAFLAGAVACLARPELFGFVLLYGAYLCVRSPRSRTLVGVSVVIVIAAWLVPSWIGSGDPLYAGTQARSEPSWSLSLAPVPWRAALHVAQSQAWLVLELAAVAAVVLAAVAVRGRRRWPPGPAQPTAVAALAGFAGANVVLYCGMTEAGFSGNARYVLPALAAIAVLGGVGAALLVEAAGRLSAAGRLVAAAALLAGAAPELVTHVGVARLEGREAIERSALHAELARAVDSVGARYTTLFGPATVNRSYQTHLAWELSLPVSDVHGARGRGISFSSSADVAGPVRILRRARPRATIVRVGSWTVTERLPNSRHVFTWPVQGFSLRAAAARYSAAARS